MKRFFCNLIIVLLSVCSLSFIGINTDAFAATGSVWVKGSNVNVREQPNTDCKSLGKVNTGTKLGLYEKRTDGWSRVDYNGKEAYIKSEFLSDTAVSQQVPAKGSAKVNSTGIVSYPNNDLSNAVSSSKQVEAMVYISKSGECYHSNPSCSRMKNPDKVTLDYAVSIGRRPCSKCY